MSKRAIIYARVSTDDQRGNYSIPTQIEECMRYAESKNYSVMGDLFVDPTTGFESSGTNAIPAYVDDFTSREIIRPAISAALTFLEKTGVDVVIVHALDRLARNVHIRHSLEQEFGLRGVSVEYVLGNFEQTPEGELRKDIEAVLANYENVKRTERSKRGKRGKAQRGLFVAGRPPYGYSISPKSQGGLEVNDYQAKVVQQIFSWFVHGNKSIRAIVELLTETQVVNHSGGTIWAKSTVSRILKNQTYIGLAHYNKFERKNNGKKLVQRKKDEWIPLTVTPIVDRFIFEEAQKRLQSNKDRIRKQPSREYLLAGMLICEVCGRPFFAQTHKAGSCRRSSDTQSYRHRIRHGHCQNKQIAANRIEDAVWKSLVDLLLEPERLRKGYAQTLQSSEEKGARKLLRIEELLERKLSLEQKGANLLEAYLDPDIGITKARYLSERDCIDSELKIIKKKIADIKAEIDATPVEVDFETFEAFTSTIRSNLSRNHPPSRKEMRELLQMLHIQVYMDPGKCEEFRIEGWFDTKESGLLSTTY